MKSTALRTVFVAVLFSLLSSQGSGQSAVALATRKANLNSIALSSQQRDNSNREAARQWAASKGIAVRRVLPNGRVLELQRLAPGTGPLFYLTNNIDAADTVSTDELWPGGSLGLNLDGSGMTVGEWDGGAVLAEHPDLFPRVTQVDGATSVSNHSTHVAGTLIASGAVQRPEARGMAYGADLAAYDWNNDTAEMATAAANGLLVSNHSYGVAAGWINIGGAPPDNWWWIGGAANNDLEDSNFGYYDETSRYWDEIALNAPYYLIVKAAGNDRWDTGPAPGEAYTIIDQAGTPLATSTLARPADCSPAGYDCLSTSSVAKNILTVGAVDDITGGYQPLAGPSSVVMTGFSSWGPTDDGRIKPDLVANGWLLVSTYGQDPYYAPALGTSMAAPNVTGSLLLLQEHYQDIYGTGNFMRAATLKALAIHTADEAGTADGPDYRHGWGLLNTRNAAQLITAHSIGAPQQQIIEASLTDGATDAIPITVNEAGSVVTATLVWTDPPGTPAPAGLDPVDLMLVNDLDLRITDGTSTFLPWILDPSAPADPATKGDNARDNVEQVVIKGAPAGNYSVNIKHEGTSLVDGSQPYSVILTIGPPPAVSQGYLIDEDFAGGLPAGWSVDTIKGRDWDIYTPASGDPELGNLTGGAGNFAMIRNHVGGTFANTITSLTSRLLDMSGVQSASLAFRSCVSLDYLETFNVDISSDGGASWNNVWQRYGSLCIPSVETMDLSNQLAGQAAARIRFRFDSGNLKAGFYWQVDDVQLEIFGSGSGPQPPPVVNPPGQATNPTPDNGGLDVAVDTSLAWAEDQLADSHDVYMGTSAVLDSGDFQGNHTVNAFSPATMAGDTTYYWRVDEVNADGITTGITWSFTTEESSVVTPALSLANLIGSATPASRGRWHATVQVLIKDQDGQAVESALVEGIWSQGASGGASCTTGSDGKCALQKSNLKSRVQSVVLTVNGVSKSGYPTAAAGGSVTVYQTDTNLLPIAVNDNYNTGINQTLTGNVLSNDTPGDGSTLVIGNSEPTSGVLSISADGAFSYTPATDYAGNDTFTYDISDSDSETSQALVTITVAAAEPPPPASEPTLTLTGYKRKGIQHVDLSWTNLNGASVDISRSITAPANWTTPNSGSHTDNVGAKGGGQTYEYRVCETGSTTCAVSSVTF